MSTYYITYPSGKKFHHTGGFYVLQIEELAYPVVEKTNKEVFVLDQRAIVTHDEEVIYTPRMLPLDDMHPAIAEWLNQNLDWGMVCSKLYNKRRERL